MKLQKIVELTFDIEVVHGLQVRGAEGELEIGPTVDVNLRPVRQPLTGEPYIPGSSLKGKLRSLKEKVSQTRKWLRDKKNPQNDRMVDSGGDPCGCGEPDCIICTLYGAHMNSKAECGPTRVRVRDAHLTDEWKTKFHALEAEGRQFLENKAEVKIDRNRGTGSDPRTGERIPPGTCFGGRIILHLYDVDKGKQETYVRAIEQSLGLLERADSLGASGSRGYGAVKIKNCCKKEAEVSKISVEFKAC